MEAGNLPRTSPDDHRLERRALPSGKTSVCLDDEMIGMDRAETEPCDAKTSPQQPHKSFSNNRIPHPPAKTVHYPISNNRVPLWTEKRTIRYLRLHPNGPYISVQSGTIKMHVVTDTPPGNKPPTPPKNTVSYVRPFVWVLKAPATRSGQKKNILFLHETFLIY